MCLIILNGFESTRPATTMDPYEELKTQGRKDRWMSYSAHLSRVSRQVVYTCNGDEFAGINRKPRAVPWPCLR